ncbi:MAG: VCBS repeat-containing protein, partial [Planctomycetes bacterium]|nr:VCBS repeat-containing protein [Planctomycetota bacterium]
PGAEVIGLNKDNFGATRKIYPKTNIHPTKVRANQWRYADYDGDGKLDLIVGVGDWAEYGWDNAFNERGEWTRGPLHGYVYLLRNRGATEQPEYESPRKIEAAGEPVDVFGMPSPNFADFDGDGDLDLLCGEFLDGFTYFENVGSRTAPQYAAGRRLTHDGRPIAMDLQMITPKACDWDGDGDTDLIVGDEDGRVALVEHTGRVTDGLPQFLPPRYFQQEAADVKFGALVTPYGFDWDGDSDEDLLCGNTAGYIGFLENLDGGDPPKWAAPQRLKAGGEVIRIQAGPNGSIQGPAEAKWGYTTLSAADWDHDGLPDLIVNSIWGKVVWFRNVGTRTAPKLAEAQPIEVEWKGPPPKPEWTWWAPQGNELATQWRTTPQVIDLNRDGLNDLVMLDHEGYLALFRRENRDGGLRLLPGERIFTDADGEPLRLNDGFAGRSGRRKFCLADWDGGGRLDILTNSVNADFLRNVGSSQHPWRFQNEGPVHERRLAGHTTSPTTVDWDHNGRPDLVIGGEDGFLYYLRNPHRPGQ